MNNAQVGQKGLLDKIEKQQDTYNKENEKVKNKLLEDERKTRQQMEMVSRKNNETMVKNYFQKLTDSVTSEDFLQHSGILQQVPSTQIKQKAMLKDLDNSVKITPTPFYFFAANFLASME